VPSSHVQSGLVTSANGFGINKDFAFAGGAMAAGSRGVIKILNSIAVSSVTMNGDTGTATLTHNVTDISPAGRAWAFDTGASSAFTGFRIVCSGGESDFTATLEEFGLAGGTASTGASGFMPGDFGPTTLTCTATSAGANAFGSSYYSGPDFANLSTTQSGWTSYGINGTLIIAQHAADLGTAGTETSGCTVSSNGNSSVGFMVLYEWAAGGGGGTANPLSGPFGRLLAGKL
jgi:PKD repeat protein